jgi:hypothetical protein
MQLQLHLQHSHFPPLKGKMIPTLYLFNPSVHSCFEQLQLHQEKGVRRFHSIDCDDLFFEVHCCHKKGSQAGIQLN